MYKRQVSACPGEIGVAIIINNTDTVQVNDKSVYPMMSVFNGNQALAICTDFDNKGISLATLVKIDRNRLDSKTWSPMMKDYSALVISCLLYTSTSTYRTTDHGLKEVWDKVRLSTDDRL